MFILGIDIAKLKFDVALAMGEKYKHKIFSNNLKGFHALYQWLKKHNVTQLHACLEATSTYGEALACFLFEKGFTVSVVNPFQIKSFSKGKLARNKSDKIDSIIIAEFCRKMEPSAWEPTPSHLKELQALVRRLDSLLDLVNQESNRLDTADKITQPWIEESITFLKNQIKTIRKHIQDHINLFPDLKSNSELLSSISGIGAATIAQVLAFMGDVSRFESAKQVVAFVGLNPKKQESGSSVKGKVRISKMGNSQLRKAFYMPAIVATKHNPLMKQFADKLKKKGKSGKVIICAVMRKLIHLIYGILKSGIPFNPDYLVTKAG